MAGYFSKLVGHVYTGDFLAGAALQNGNFVTLSAGKAYVTTAAKNTVMRVAEKTSKWGLPFVVLDVVSIGTDEVFFVENEWDIDDNKEYDETTYAIAANSYVRMKRPLPGEQICMSVSDALYASLSEDDAVTPAANGTIAASE